MDGELNRRAFLKAAGLGAGGLLIALHVPGLAPLAHAAEGAGTGADAAANAATLFKPNAFVQIDGAGQVTLFVSQAEMGQGVRTSLPMLVAEELDIDLDKVIVQGVGADPAFNHPWFGSQVTGGSTSVRGLFEPLRRAGAEARYQLLEAAASRLEVPRESLRTENGEVIHEASGRRLSYGELVAAAAALPAPDPAAITLKSPENFRYIGRARRRSEGPSKVTGAAKFGIDVQLEGLMTAVVARPPVFGATLKSVDDSAALKIPGVRKVKPVPEGVAVIADHFWAAKLGREALTLDWDLGAMVTLDSETQGREYAALAETEGAVATTRGLPTLALDAEADAIALDLDVPYLAHATMEPLNATVHHAGDSAEVWTGTQMQGADRARAAAVLGLAEDKVTLHNLLLGGGFGRRANPSADFVVLAANVAKGEGLPIKTVWTREDDTRGGWYRPRAFHRIRVRLNEDGLPLAWHQRIVAQSIMTGTPFEAIGIKDGVDDTVVEGAKDLPYAIPNLQVECHLAPAGVPVLWWRAVGHTHTALAVEHMIDLAARRAGVDPIDYRRRLLEKTPQWLAVLDLIADKSGWGSALAEGRARGLAIHASFGTVVAQVAEVSIENGRPRVHRVVAVADMGRVINPLHAKAQIESGIVFGLSAALHQQITFKEGRVQQSNFHDYPLLRQNEMPLVDVHLVESENAPGGAGEPGTPPIAPAVANALLVLTGKATTSLPFGRFV
jgi:isoquinoline 1-oxidoreductase beta subunit